jgi:hypothetical protein
VREREREMHIKKERDEILNREKMESKGNVCKL